MAPLLQIFISSPGDVEKERLRAGLVIEKLAKDYARFFDIRPFRWEREVIRASGHFQDNTIPPSQTDIVVLILWSKLGTYLPHQTALREYRGIDGRQPVTGTEWEFEEALAGHRKNAEGLPDLLAYRNRSKPQAEYETTDDLDELSRQKSMLDAFWAKHCADDSGLKAGFWEFDSLDAFEARLESDLRSLIERRITALRAQGRTAPTPVWLTGSPFRGLETYHLEHAPIFFGRSAATKMGVE